jgi:hypothetical protein
VIVGPGEHDRHGQRSLSIPDSQAMQPTPQFDL